MTTLVFVEPDDELSLQALAFARRLGGPVHAVAIDPANVSVDGDRGTRIRWGGSLYEEARLHGEPKLLTVAPHALPAEAPGVPAATQPFAPSISAADEAVRVLERVEEQSSGVSLRDAKVVVSGGRGVGSAEGFG